MIELERIDQKLMNNPVKVYCEIPEWTKRLARDLEIIADGLEERNKGENYDAETHGYIRSHRVCASHIREHAGRKLGRAGNAEE